MLKIIADEAIPWLDKLFATHGEIHRYSGRDLNQSLLKDADVLLIRSTVNITRHVLENTSVKLVASATVGCDHVDQGALSDLGVAFVHAPGCNANAVSEYVVAAIAWHAKQGKLDLGKNLNAAIIGCGQIGSKVKQKLELFGFDVSVNDPPVENNKHDQARSWNFVSLDEALNADVICMHTPLTKHGKNPTYHLLDSDQLKKLNNNAVLINAGRGEVIHNQALSNLLDRHSELNVTLDVWEGEPSIDRELLRKVNLGTPHIAGHSWRGKVMGTVMIYQQACNYFGWAEQKIDEKALAVPLPEFEGDDNSQLYDLIAKCYDIEAETAELRNRIFNKEQSKAAREFDHFRKSYYQRPEFSDLTCRVKPSISNIVKSLGFNVLA